MINSIPQKQLCEAFDPMVIITKKHEQILSDPLTVNTGCVCPAYVYMEGIHGKRFLCDFHYFYEKDIVLERTPELWPEICKYLIDNLENIKETFVKNPGTTPQLLNEKCINENCVLLAYVKCIAKDGKEENFCNFHYRKKYYRYLSNKVVLEELYVIIDERYKMPYSIKEEFNLLTWI
jgi:hypothetical protein